MCFPKSIFMNLTQKLKQRASLWQNYLGYNGKLHHTELKGKVASRMMYEEREYIIWCLNDYLGLMDHPDGIQAAAKATASYGPSYPHSVRLTIGHTAFHAQLEQEIASFMEREEAMLVNLGYQGFLSIIDALTDRHDTLIYDQSIHACLIDGVRLHNGRKFAFQHNSIEHLETQLQRASKTHNPETGTIIVIVDGLYSMGGELAPLDAIAKLKEQYDFALFVDDSHAFGVFGDQGRGAPQHFDVEDQVDVYVSTFTKSFGNLGGFVAAKKEIIDYLRFTVRSQIFSRTMPLPMVLSVLKNLETFQREPERRTRLWNNTRKFQQGLRALGLNIGKTESPITPVRINGSLQEGLEVLTELRELGVFSYIAAYPVVPKGTCLIRMVCTYNHTEQDIEETLEAFKILKHRFPERLSPSPQIERMSE